MTVIECDHLSKAYGRKVAVNRVAFRVQPGEVYGFLGPNGAGKTTTIRMLLGLVRPTEGQVMILGQNPHKRPEILRRVGAMVEGATFYPYLSGWDNLNVVGNSRGRFDASRARELAEHLALTDALHQQAGQYSTGMRQRLGIVAALLNDPALVILDEPTSGMDPAGIRDMRQFLRSLVDQGRTVFLTSHLLAEVQQVCDRVAIIHQGQIVREGPIRELLNPRPQLFATVSDLPQAESALNARWPVRCEAAGLRIEAEYDEAPAVLQQLTERGVRVFSIAPYQTSLESYFLELVEEQPS